MRERREEEKLVEEEAGSERLAFPALNLRRRRGSRSASACCGQRLQFRLNLQCESSSRVACLFASLPLLPDVLLRKKKTLPSTRGKKNIFFN